MKLKWIRSWLIHLWDVEKHPDAFSRRVTTLASWEMFPLKVLFFFPSQNSDIKENLLEFFLLGHQLDNKMSIHLISCSQSTDDQQQKFQEDLENYWTLQRNLLLPPSGLRGSESTKKFNRFSFPPQNVSISWGKKIKFHSEVSVFHLKLPIEKMLKRFVVVTATDAESSWRKNK